MELDALLTVVKRFVQQGNVVVLCIKQCSAAFQTLLFIRGDPHYIGLRSIQ